MTGNSFLDSLAFETRARIFPQLVHQTLQRSRVLAEPGATTQDIYFPIQSVISTVTQMADGAAVEVGLAGHEGMSALSLAFGSRTTPHTTMVQIPDGAYSMSAEAFLGQLGFDAALKSRVLSYAEYSFNAAAQFVACNRLHAVEERYARWILMADDRVGEREFMLTQEFTAQMLGVRRASVTVIAGVLSASGLIGYRRGRLSVLDRAGLEETSCECYGVVNRELQRLMGYGSRQTSLSALNRPNDGSAERAAAVQERRT